MDLSCTPKDRKVFSRKYVIFSISSSLNLKHHQLDIETIFLHGELKEIYDGATDSYFRSNIPNLCLQISQIIICSKIVSTYVAFQITHLFCFHWLQPQPNIYIHKEGNIYVIIGVYVDNLPIASNSLTSICNTINQFFTKDKFLVKECGPLEYCLRIKVSQSYRRNSNPNTTKIAYFQ